MSKYRRWPRVNFVHHRMGNCWRWWSFSRRVYWSGGLTYYSWWKFCIVLDWRPNFLADMFPEVTRAADAKEGA